VSADQLPADVTLFLRTHIPTVLQLELLLLLHGNADRWWTAESANREHQSTVDATRRYLQTLCDAKLLECRSEIEPQFKFAAEREQDRATIAVLARLFRTHYYSIVDAIYAPRRKDIHDFAEAFRLNKKKDGDG
jgi:hypothetical protein